MAKTTREEGEPISEEYLEYRLNMTAKAHRAAGLEEAAKILLKEVGERFMRGDEGADAFRDMSRLLERHAKEARREQRLYMQANGDSNYRFIS